MTQRPEVSSAKFAVYGAGGCGRGVLPVARTMLSNGHCTTDYELVFVDDAARAPVINGHRVLSYADFRASPVSLLAVCIAVADSRVRQELAERCLADGIEAFSVVAPSTVIMDDVQIGEGAILSPNVVLTSNIRIGKHFHANIASSVEHDCLIGDFVTFAPGARCNGNTVIEDHAYLGSGCVLRQGQPGRPLVIGRGAVVGMGAVVTESVSAGTTVVGNPARPLRK